MRHLAELAAAAAAPGARVRRGRRAMAGTRGLCAMPRVVAVLAAGLLVAESAPARAEYGDVVLNKRSEQQGMRPVVFPHWFHRIRFRCKVCHSELGFRMRAGANDVTMAQIVEGQFCGMCHDGQIAWAPDRCDLCHSGRKGLPSGILGSHGTSGPGRW